MKVSVGTKELDGGRFGPSALQIYMWALAQGLLTALAAEAVFMNDRGEEWAPPGSPARQRFVKDIFHSQEVAQRSREREQLQVRLADEVRQHLGEICVALYEWARSLPRETRGVTSSMVADAYLDGFKADGVKAHRVKEWQRGAKRSVELPFVIEMPCPREDRTENRHRVANVRLLIEEDGWFTVDPDSECPKCDQTAMNVWAMSCRGCAGREDQDDHEDHAPDVQSPIGHVIRAVYLRAAAMSLGIAPAPRQVARRRWNLEGAVQFLDDAKDAEGSPLVPVSLGQNAAFEAIKHLPDHPRKELVNAAQKIRKERP